MASESSSPASSPSRSPSPASPTKSASKKRKAHSEIEVDLSLPEPPSKKARRALKKGKDPVTSRRQKDDGADLAEEDAPDSNEPGKDKDGAENENGAKKPKHGEHGVWIGNLSFETTPAQLKKWLVENSNDEITESSITRVNMPTSKPSASATRKDKDAPAKRPNKGFAYVDFADAGPQMIAIALSNTDLGGRKLLIKDSKSFDGRPAKSKAEIAAEETAEKINKSPKIFVGNLSFQANEDAIWEHFSKCGEIEWVKVATFEDTGKCKGYGWVKFKDAEGATSAVRGFARIKEEIDTEEADGGEEEDGNSRDRKKKQKTKKWWVNRMFGRDLKIELAEDDQSRYQKRFGKGTRTQGPAARAEAKA